MLGIAKTHHESGCGIHDRICRLQRIPHLSRWENRPPPTPPSCRSEGDN